MDRRILELALESLIAKKNTVEAEIAEIRAELAGLSKSSGRTAKAAPANRRRRARTATERKAQSTRMKAYWAKRKSESARKA